MPANYVLLQSIQLTANAASVTFANIPQSGYTDLKMVVSARSSQTDFAVTDIYASFNGTSANQTQRNLRGYFSGAISQSRTDVLVGNMPSAVNTTSVFANTEMYISNYTSTSTFKSISVDGVSESNTNATGFDFWLNLGANLVSSNAAIASITLIPSGGNLFVIDSTFYLYGIAAVGTTPVIAPKATGGDTIYNDGTNWIHIFNSTGVFTPQTGLSCDYLVVAGGGAGGGGSSAGNPGAGGGAGGYLTGSGLSVSAQNYTIQVGAGGTGASNATGGNGTNSIFASITSTGGGGGATAVGTGTPTAGLAGGSSGGVAAWNPTSNLGGTAPSPAGQGNAGGGIFSAGNNGRAGAGGGGAGSAGGNGDTNGGIGGGGGSGTANSISGTSVTYAGGGGGSGTSGSTGAGGAGGGGAGANGLSAGNAGTRNTGGGGGGLRDGGGSGLGGAGGSGIVIIRYPIA